MNTTVKPRADVRLANKKVRFVTALLTACAVLPSAAYAQENARPDDTTESDVIVVTAQKRGEERLLDVPIPLTAIGAETMIENNETDLREISTRVPGLNVNEQGAYVGSTISIRGITTGSFNDGTTGVVIDDVPYGSSAQLGDIVAEIDPSDLLRLEVLRGPQGTLYGASSMGGLLRYVTIDPSTDGVSGQLRVGVSDTVNGDSLGHYASGAVNVPLSDTFAIRTSVFTRHNPGWIDDPVHGIDGVNSSDAFGARLVALWAPSDNFSLRLGALTQESEYAGLGFVNLLPGETEPQGLTQNNTPHSGGGERSIQAYTANINANVGSVELDSISAFVVTNMLFNSEIKGLGFITTPLFGPAFTGINVAIEGDMEKFTQEFRAAFPLGANADLQLGVFYSQEDFRRLTRWNGANPTTGEVAGQILFGDAPATYTEYAVFSNLTYRFTDQFDVQIGGRLSRSVQESPYAITSGNVINSSAPAVDSEDDSFTYLVTPRYKITPDVMLYARFASGYRPGGPNANRLAHPAVPAQFEPDTTASYEIGIKGEIFDRALTIDASAFFIDWENIQLANLFTPNPAPNFAYTDNVGAAESKGVEIALRYTPTDDLTIGFTGAWTTAQLTEDFPLNQTLNGRKGDSLPFTPEFAGSVYADYEFPLWGDVSGTIGGSVSYVGDRKAFFFFRPAEQQVIPSYVDTDLHAGIEFDTWRANLSITNVFDERNSIFEGTGGSPPEGLWIYTRPRTVSLTLSTRF
jgi:outer membrane receptor protein involved in Fe transport